MLMLTKHSVHARVSSNHAVKKDDGRARELMSCVPIIAKLPDGTPIDVPPGLTLEIKSRSEDRILVAATQGIKSDGPGLYPKADIEVFGIGFQFGQLAPGQVTRMAFFGILMGDGPCQIRTGAE